MNPAMDVTELKPHLVYELIGTLYEKCVAKRSKLGHFFDKIINIDPMITIAMSGPSELSKFVRFIKFNFILCNDEDCFVFLSNQRTTQLTSSHRNALSAFFSMTSGVWLLDCPIEDTVWTLLGGLNDLRYIDVDCYDFDACKKFSQVAHIFAKVNDLDINVLQLSMLLKHTSISFPALKRLNIKEDTYFVERIKTTPERFPCLEHLEIETKEYGNASKRLKFAQDSFSTVKNLTINITENVCSKVFSELFIELVANWLKSFKSLTTAKIVIEKHLCSDYNYVYFINPDDTIRVHNAFKRTDFNVDLELSFKLVFYPFNKDRSETKSNRFLQHMKKNLPFFTRITNSDPATFVYKVEMPGKTFQHIVTAVYD